MIKQKFQVGEEQVWILETEGEKKPLALVEILSYKPDNENPYKVKYHLSGATKPIIEEVKEERLASLTQSILEVLKKSQT